MIHYTNSEGHKSIGSQVTWIFRAGQPPANHPFGAYFTDLPPDTNNLAYRLRVPKSKVEFMFQFKDIGDLKPLPGGRGAHIFYYPGDYAIHEGRQERHGETGIQ